MLVYQRVKLETSQMKPSWTFKFCKLSFLSLTLKLFSCVFQGGVVVEVEFQYANFWSPETFSQTTKVQKHRKDNGSKEWFGSYGSDALKSGFSNIPFLSESWFSGKRLYLKGTTTTWGLGPIHFSLNHDYGRKGNTPTSMKQIHPVAPFKRRNPRRSHQVHVHDPAVHCHAVLRVALVALKRRVWKLHSSSWSVPFAKISRWSFMNVQSQSAPPGWKLVWKWVGR